jgi:hypothetical protein
MDLSVLNEWLAAFNNKATMETLNNSVSLFCSLLLILVLFTDRFIRCYSLVFPAIPRPIPVTVSVWCSMQLCTAEHKNSLRTLSDMGVTFQLKLAKMRLIFMAFWLPNLCGDESEHQAA